MNVTIDVILILKTLQLTTSYRTRRLIQLLLHIIPFQLSRFLPVIIVNLNVRLRVR